MASLSLISGMAKTRKALAFIVLWAGCVTNTLANQDCDTLFDFTQSGAFEQWRPVNDNVMGGRSSGGPSAVLGGMRFSGVINTNGGGFSSVRARLPRQALMGMNALRLNWKPDNRRYQISIQTNITFRGRPVAYRSDLRSLTTDAWTQPTVFFSELKPTVFGQRINAPAFEADNARSISIFVNDGKDGPFVATIATISACAL